MHCWWDCKLPQPPWKTAQKFLRNLKIALSCDPAIALLGMYPEKTKTLIQKDIFIAVFIAALFIITKV